MNVTIFGASGNIGRRVVDLLVKDGHQLTVFVHASSPFASSEQIRVVKGDIHNAALVEEAVQGSDAVISTLGSWHTPTKDILSAAMRFAIPAMQQQGTRRIITLTGSGAWAPGEHITIANKLQHTVFSLVAKDILRDGEEHLRLLANSGLDWTSLRAPVMRNSGTTNYKLNNTLPKAWETINRQAVAQAMVDQLSDASHLGQAPHIHGR